MEGAFEADENERTTGVQGNRRRRTAVHRAGGCMTTEGGTVIYSLRPALAVRPFTGADDPVLQLTWANGDELKVRSSRESPVHGGRRVASAAWHCGSRRTTAAGHRPSSSLDHEWRTRRRHCRWRSSVFECPTVASRPRWVGRCPAPAARRAARLSPRGTTELVSPRGVEDGPDTGRARVG